MMNCLERHHHRPSYAPSEPTRCELATLGNQPSLHCLMRTSGQPGHAPGSRKSPKEAVLESRRRPPCRSSY